MPIAAATKTGGAMNCHTDTPADRATTSSSLRDKLRNAIIAPNNTAKGRACSATIGVCSSDSQAISGATAPGVSPERRSISTTSIA